MNYQTQIHTFKTADNERLHGALLTPPDSATDLGLIFVHGVAMNFYLPPLFSFGQALAQRGYHCFVINTRGHDWIARAGNLQKFGGSAYENLVDCVADLDAAITFLNQRGYKRFILIGHSLGAIKSIIYQGTQRRSDIASIVSCSAPKQFYSERVERQPKFRELIATAEQMVEDGKSEELMMVPVGVNPGLFTARTHLDKYGKDDGNDCRPHAKNVGCPILAIAGGAEPPFFHDYAKEIVAAAGGQSKYQHVDGANHFYNRHITEMVEVIGQWLEKFRD
jgi:pimeloyl-ACP methyl ester carboxylesterase